MTLAKKNAFDFFVSFEALEEIQRAEPGSAKSFKPDPLGHIQTAGMRPLGLKIAASCSFPKLQIRSQAVQISQSSAILLRLNKSEEERLAEKAEEMGSTAVEMDEWKCSEVASIQTRLTNKNVPLRVAYLDWRT